MALFDFLKKKKEDDLGDLGGDLGADFGAEPAFPGAGGNAGMPNMPNMPGMGGPIPGMPSGGIPGMPNMQGGNMFGQDMGGGAQGFQMPPPPPGMAQPMSPTSISFQPQPFQQQQSFGQSQGAGSDSRMIADMVRNQIDVVVTRLDSLKASVDRINERLEYIERYLIRR
jgi:hypothetical protein